MVITAEQPDRAHTGRERNDAGRVAVIAALVLTGFSLRPAVTSLGAALDAVRADLGMSVTVAGVVDALPVLCFAALGALAPRLARWWAPTRVLTVASAAMAAGLGLRVTAAGVGMFVAGSVLALSGIAVAGVLLPALVRVEFAERVGLMTGVFTFSVNLGVAVPAAISLPVGEALGGGWRTGLGVWAIVPALAVVAWLVARRGGSALPAGPAPSGDRSPSPWRSAAAWALLVYFGLQSLVAFVVLSWLPSVLTDAGVPAGTAGLLLSVTAFAAVPFTLALPPWAARSRRPGVAVVVIGASVAVGFVGLLVAPAAAPWLWALLLTGVNCTFPLAVTFIATRARDGQAVRLSGFVQTGGYLLAAVGPLAMGSLKETTGSWTTPILLVLGALVVQVVAGVVAARPVGR